MNYVVYALSVALIGIIIGRVRVHNLKQQTNTKESKQVRLPKANLWIGLIGMSLFGGFIILSYIFPGLSKGRNIYSISFFLLFILAGLVLIVGYLNCRIDIYKDTFVYHTFFGRKYEISYLDIIDSKEGRTMTHIYTKTKHLYLDHSAIGDTAFFLAWDRCDQRHKRELAKVEIIAHGEISQEKQK